MPPLSECLDQKWPRIRLLTLSGAHSPTFEAISLETHWSTAPEKYIALSYVWGKSEPDDPYITVNKRPVQVRKNLYEAMKQTFRHRLQGLKRHLEQQNCSHRDECTCSEHPPDDLRNSSIWAQHNPLRLWIDALCINQNDHREKSNQVGKMGRIFSSASLVLAWTGLPRDGSDDAIRVLGMPSDELSQLVTTGGLTETLRASVLSFCERTYWRRVWILQELVLAKDYFVMCGSESVASKSLDRNLTELSWWDNQRLNSNGAAADSQQRIGTTPAYNILFYKRTTGFCMLFRWLLLCIRSNLQATVPHDYIYALLSISWDDDFETSHGQIDKSKIEVDYDKPVAEVFCQLLQSFVDDPTWWHSNWLLELAQTMTMAKEEAATLMDAEHQRRRRLGPIRIPTQDSPGLRISSREKQKNLFDRLPVTVLRAIQKQLDQGHIDDFEVELDKSVADFYRQLLESCRNNPPRGFSMERTFPPSTEAADDMVDAEEHAILEDEFMRKSVSWTEYREYKRETMSRRAQKISGR